MSIIKFKAIVANKSEFSKAIEGEQSLDLAYNEHQIYKKIYSQINYIIQQIGIEGLDGTNIQPDVCMDWDKVYNLEITDIYEDGEEIIIILNFVGFLK